MNIAKEERFSPFLCNQLFCSRYSFSGRMVQVVLSFKMGKVDTDLRTVAAAPCILQYFCALTWSVYFLYGPRPLFLVTLETPFTSSKSMQPRSVSPF